MQRFPKLISCLEDSLSWIHYARGEKLCDFFVFRRSSDSWLLISFSYQTEKLVLSSALRPLVCPRLRLPPFPTRWVNILAVSARLLPADLLYLHLICEGSSSANEDAPSKLSLFGDWPIRALSVRAEAGLIENQMKQRPREMFLLPLY